MSFVVYNLSSTAFLRVFRNGFWQDAIYKTQGGATRALNSAVSAGRVQVGELGILPMSEFKKIEKKRNVKNLMTGLDVEISVNTPASCDPSTETYWSL